MKLTTDNAKGASTLIIVIVAVVLAVVLFKDLKKVFDGLLERLGLRDSKEAEENKNYINDYVNRENAKGVQSAWSPKYYTVVLGSTNGYGFTVQQAQDLCKKIWDSVGYLYDSPNEAASAIKQCKNKRNVSFLADGMSDIYGVDLLNWLENKMDSNEQREVLAGIFRFVDSLPKN